MKRRQKLSWFLSGVLAAALVVNLATPAFASLASKVISVYSGVQIYVDGVKMEPKDERGNPVETFLYNGTNYVPLRAVSQYLGKAVKWDGSTRTVYIGEVPGQKQYLIDVCPPYQTSDYEEPTTLNISGVKYANGFAMGYNNSFGGWALYNLNGQYQTLEFDFGHVDGRVMRNSTVNIYLDGALALSLDVDPEMLLTHYSVPLNGALQMKIETTSYGGVYGFVNVTID